MHSIWQIWFRYFVSSQSLQTALVGCFRKKLHSSPSLFGDLEEKNDPPPDSWRIFVKQEPLLNFIFRKIWQPQNHPATCILLSKKVRSVCQIVGEVFHPSKIIVDPTWSMRKDHWKWNLFDTIVVFTQVADLGGSILATPADHGWDPWRAIATKKNPWFLVSENHGPLPKTSKIFVGELRHLLSPQCSLFGYNDCIWLWKYFGWNVDCSSSSVQFHGSCFLCHAMYMCGVCFWDDMIVFDELVLTFSFIMIDIIQPHCTEYDSLWW